MTRSLLQQAFAALHPQARPAFVEATKDALREALAAPQPEPVATVVSWTNGTYWRNYQIDWHKDVDAGANLYAAAPPAAPIDGFGGNLDSAFDAPAAPADMVMVDALRKARKALDGIDATACCDHWANMNSSARRYAIARDARAAVQDIDRVLLAAAPAPVVPVSWDRLRVLMDSIPTREEFIGGQRQKYVAKEEVMGWLYEGQLRAEREAALSVAPPAAPAVPLTDADIYRIADRLWEQGHIQSLSTGTARIFARAIEKAHGIGGGNG